MKEWLPLIGVMIAQFVLVILFALKLRADDKRRWHEKRLDAYRALSAAGRTASAVFASAEELEDLDDHRFVAAMNASDASELDIAFLATDLVKDKAGILQAYLEMCVVLHPRDRGFPTAADLIQARGEFETAVRQELGIDRKRTFIVTADSPGQLLWRSIELLAGSLFGSVGLAGARLILDNRGRTTTEDRTASSNGDLGALDARSKPKHPDRDI